MARLTFPDEGSRLAYGIVAGSPAYLAPVSQGTVVSVWTDSSATVAADCQHLNGFPVTVLTPLTIDEYTRLPLFLGPDGVDTVWVTVAGSPPTPVYARFDDRLDAALAGGSSSSSWGARWKTARASASAPARLTVLGGGESQLYATSPASSWVGLVRAALQGAYGNGGSGWAPVTRSAIWYTAANVPAATVTSLVAAGGVWTLTGTWQTWQGPAGPGGNGRAISTTQVGAAATYTVHGSTVRIYTVGGGPNFNYTVDGAGTTFVAQTGPGIQVTTITGLSAANHTVTVGYPAFETLPLVVVGVEALRGTGVVVDDHSFVGATAATWAAGDDDHFEAARWAGGTERPADALVYALGLEDAAAGRPAADFSRDVRRCLEVVRGGQTADVPLIFLVHHAGQADPSYIWHEYSTVLRGLADAYAGQVVDLWRDGSNSWPVAFAAGRWGSHTSLGGQGSDPRYLSDLGHTRVRDLLLPHLSG